MRKLLDECFVPCPLLIIDSTIHPQCLNSDSLADVPKSFFTFIHTNFHSLVECGTIVCRKDQILIYFILLDTCQLKYSQTRYGLAQDINTIFTRMINKKIKCIS